MYNLRVIEYPTGYQVRRYDHTVFDLGECLSGDVAVCERVQYDLPVDEWINTDFDFDTLEDDYQDRLDESVRASLARTKNMIFYLARSNVWDWFVTLTLDPERIDRYDFALVSKKVRKFFNNLRRKAPSLYYLIVPERHKDGAWHLHGLLGGCDGLSFVDSGVQFDGEPVYNFVDWRFGFSTATAVRDTRRVSGYISKYITKSLVIETKGLQRYWVSKNCYRAEVKDYLVGPAMMEQIRLQLLLNMTWQKRVDNAFVTCDYVELPADFVLDLGNSVVDRVTQM